MVLIFTLYPSLKLDSLFPLLSASRNTKQADIFIPRSSPVTEKNWRENTMYKGNDSGYMAAIYKEHSDSQSRRKCGKFLVLCI